MNEKYRLQTPEVLYSKVAVTTVDQSDIELFKQLSLSNPRKRIRLCAHDSSDECLHEMLIVHDHSAYVRPHKHPGKTESTHIIEGLVDVIVFDDGGQIERVISMGDYTSGMTFYYRMAVPVFHTMIIRSDVLVFHETINGPFERGDTVFAPWAPEEGDANSVINFMATLDGKIKLLQKEPTR